MDENNHLKQLAANAKKEAQFYAYLKQNPEKHIRELARKETARLWEIRTEIMGKLNVPRASQVYTPNDLQKMLTLCLDMRKGLLQILGYDWERFSGYPDWELIYKSEAKELDENFKILIEDLRNKISLSESRKTLTGNNNLSDRKRFGIMVYLKATSKGNTFGIISKTIRELLAANGYEPDGPMFQNVRQSYSGFMSMVRDKKINPVDISALQELLPSLNGKEYDLAFEILQKARKTPG